MIRFIRNSLLLVLFLIGSIGTSRSYAATLAGQPVQGGRTVEIRFPVAKYFQDVAAQAGNPRVETGRAVLASPVEDVRGAARAPLVPGTGKVLRAHDVSIGQIRGSGFSLLLGQLGAFFGARAASFGATGECDNLGMLGAGFRQLLTGARTNLADWVGVFRPALEQLTGERRNPRTIAGGNDDLSDDVDILLGKPFGYQTFTAASCDITRFDTIAKFWRPHR